MRFQGKLSTLALALVALAAASSTAAATLRPQLDVETSWYLEVVSAIGHKVVVGHKYGLVRYT
jgi:hypothetical protein